MNNTSVLLVDIHRCFAEFARLRIVGLLLHGPLCVRELQTILQLDQVKVSKHLAYLRQRGLLDCTRQGNRRLYHLPANPPPILEVCLTCLRECANLEASLQADRAARASLVTEIRRPESALQPASPAPDPTRAGAPEPPPAAGSHWPFYGGDDHLD